MLVRKPASLAIALLIVSASSMAQREPVLKQIDEPHPYYVREMYLPQLTTGPSWVAWSPDSKAVVYSMAGSLWLQKLDSEVAEQLTAGPGYDYQPDWSSDGRWIVYSKYDKDAIELWAYEVAKKQAHALTQNGAVNVEPRFAPNCRRIAFVSTSFNGRFHIFAGSFEGGELHDVEQMTSESRTSLPRYYYSEFDHEISPAWLPDSSELFFVSNRRHIYGSGGFWRMKSFPGAEAWEIHYEETSWKARPDISPDGRKIVYSSYLGRAWHQLWVIPVDGGEAFPLTYGDFDNTNPRWSWDGHAIAFISNRDGNTSLWIQTYPGGLQQPLVAKEKHYLADVGRIALTVTDPAGRPVTARVSITGEDRRAYAPQNAWMHADDGFDRSERPFEAHYFHSTGRAELDVPAGHAIVDVTKGFEYRFERQTVEVKAGQTTPVTIRLQSIDLPKSTGTRWVSGDAHVHMNYGGAYRNTPANLVVQAAAENLPIVQNLVVNKERRIPDMPYFRTTADPASTQDNLLLHGQEFHTSYWGHLGLLHLTRNFLIPDYAGYPSTVAASLSPSNSDVADMAHAQQALVGYVHPFDTYPDPAKDALTNELPVDVALGKVDYIEILGFSDHKSTAHVWYQLLNCGFHLPAAAGTDAMANFASLRGPVGLNRVYVNVPSGPLDVEPWLANLKAGRTFATNGPLLGFSLEDKQIGDELKLSAGRHEVKFRAWLRSTVPMDHLELICNGQVALDLKLAGNSESADEKGTLPISTTGWCLLRAWNEKGTYPVLDQYPYATTSPIYVTVEGSKISPKNEATYFIAWINQLVAAAQANKDWNSEPEKLAVLDELVRARKVYEDLQK